MSTNNLRLQVILQTIDKASAVLKKIQGGSTDAAKALKQTREQLDKLNKVQGDVRGYRLAAIEIARKKKALTDLNAKVSAYSASLAQQSAAHTNIKGSLKAAKLIHDQLSQAYVNGTNQSAAHTRQIELARITLLSTQQAYERSLASIKKYQTQVKNAGERVGQLTSSQKAAEARLQGFKTRLDAAGISTTGLSARTRAAREEQKRLTDSIKAQQEALKKLAEQQRKMGEARTSRDTGVATAGKMAAVGATSAFGGLAVLRGMHSPIEESKLFITETQRIAALGLGDKVTADAIKFAKGMQTYGTSTRDNVSLLKDALTVFADLHHAEMVAPTLAKMKFANEAVFGAEKGGDNEKKFMDMMKVVELRGGVNSSEAFNTKADMIQRVITATGGRVQGEEWLNLVKRGGTAARGISDEALYYQMEPMVQAMSGDGVGTAMMSAYQALYQGKTTKRAANLLGDLGMITDPSKVQHDKAGQIAHIGPGALKGSDVFRRNQFEWMETVLLPQLAKKGITDSEKIKDVMGGILSNRTASNLFTTMYDLRGAIHKNAALNAGADGIQQLHDRAKQMPSGNELELLARKKNAYKEFGDAVMPAYIKAIEIGTAALKGLTSWMQENPRTARVMAIGLGAIAVGMVALGGLLLVISPMLVTFFTLRYLLAAAGIQGGVFTVVMGALRSALGSTGLALLKLGRMLLLNPIGLAITAIAIAAFLIYKNWGPISEFFTSLWDNIKSAASTAWNWITSKVMGVANAIGNFLMNWTIVGFIAEHWEDLKAITLAVWDLIKNGITAVAQGIFDFFMKWSLVGIIVRHWDSITAGASAAWQWIKDKAIAAGQGIADFFMNWSLLGLIIKNWDSITSFMSGQVGKFMTIGGQIMDGLISGFLWGITALKNAVNGVGESAIGWFKEKLGIHSPSRVFMAAGQNISDGAALGISSRYDRVRKATAGLSLAALGTLPLATGAAPLRMDTRPPLSAASAGAGIAASTGPSTISITINAAPGMDVQALARAVSAELDKRERQKRASSRSSLSDLN